MKEISKQKKCKFFLATGKNDEEQKIYESIYEFNHTGELPGYLSIARYHKDLDAVVVQFVNTSGGTSWSKMEIVYNRIIGILKEN